MKRRFSHSPIRPAKCRRLRELGGVHPSDSGVYTQKARGCTPMGLGGVHPRGSGVYTPQPLSSTYKPACFFVQPYYRPPRIASLPQNRRSPKFISSQKRRILQNIAVFPLKHPWFHPDLRQIEDIYTTRLAWRPRRTKRHCQTCKLRHVRYFLTNCRSALP